MSLFEPGKVIKLTDYIEYVRQQNDSVLGYYKVPEDTIRDHFKSLSGLGEGIYSVRVYLNDDSEGLGIRGNTLSSGVAAEENSGNADSALENHRAELHAGLTNFSAEAHKLIAKPQDIIARREDHMSFLGAQCKGGIITAAWYDTVGPDRTLGMSMLVFLLYALGIINAEFDSVLRVVTRNHMPNKEGFPKFNPEKFNQQIINSHLNSILSK